MSYRIQVGYGSCTVVKQELNEKLWKPLQIQENWLYIPYGHSRAHLCSNLPQQSVTIVVGAYFLVLLFSKMKTNFSWTNTSEFWAENMPQKSEKKVEEHKVSSEFRSDA